MKRKASNSNRSADGISVLLILAVTLALALALFLAYRFLVPQLTAYSGSGTQSATDSQSLSPSEEATEPTPVVTADGAGESLRCQSSYSVAVSAAQEAAGKTVATMGEETLTNAQLQVYYLNAIQAHRLSGAPQQPETSLPLEVQPCPLGDGNLSWQHYFLQSAIDSWQMETLLLNAAQQPRIIQEEAYKPNEVSDLHGKHLAEDLPVHKYLYADKSCYTPNSMHQKYLDSLEETMTALASQAGYSQLSDYAQAVFGSTVSAQELVDAARRFNTAYMLFTEDSYDITVTQEQVDEYHKAHSDVTGEEARQQLLQELQLEPWQKQAAKKAVTPDYSAVALWVDPQKAAVLPVDVLYPDVAHERFPEPITYFQQDYYYHRFGNTGAIVGQSGCGITTFAMLATYMTDEIHSPAMMADRFPDYYAVGGTKGELFEDGPEVMGFQLDCVVTDCSKALPALENGQMVVCRQKKGEFTDQAHYLLLTHYDAESKTVELRDSNIYKYGDIMGHKKGFFSWPLVLENSDGGYIMEKKVVTTPSCPRCGDNPQPDVNLNSSALCDRCTKALIRRNAFLTLMAQK